jgi:hypothetical protein
MDERNCYKTDVAECIRKKAYELWEKDERKERRDYEYWLIAESTVKPRLRNNSPKYRA